MSPAGSSSREAGFALIAVIWSLGLITLMGTAVIVGARYRTKVTSSSASVVTAELAAESAINLAIFSVLNNPSDPNAFPLRCALPGEERASITMESESGKVDLNTASPAVLERLFTTLAHDQSAGLRIAASIAQFRNRDGERPRDSANMTKAGRLNTPPSSLRFKTIMQLDQIKGITPALFRTASRFVTVSSGRSDPDPAAATPALREILNLKADTSTRAPFQQNASAVTIRADISSPDGTRFIREALISFGSGDAPFLIREWRHGNIDAGDQAIVDPKNAASRGGEKRCFRIG
jgi:general secretion pathway protein K